MNTDHNDFIVCVDAMTILIQLSPGSVQRRHFSWSFISNLVEKTVEAKDLDYHYDMLLLSCAIACNDQYKCWQSRLLRQHVPYLRQVLTSEKMEAARPCLVRLLMVLVIHACPECQNHVLLTLLRDAGEQIDARIIERRKASGAGVHECGTLAICRAFVSTLQIAGTTAVTLLCIR